MIDRSRRKTVGAYLEVLKPGATILLTFVAVAAAFVASDGLSSEGSVNKLVLAAATVLTAGAGANGLTNYADRDIDGRMQRTKRRALPSGVINPAWKVLPLTIGLTVTGLILSWQLQPVFRLAFIADVVGTVSALAWRKKATCVFPQGLLAGCTPVLIGWFAIEASFNWELVLLCGVIGLWLPLHVWSVMIANREDYLMAGLTFFPMNRTTRQVAKLLLVFSLALSVLSIALYLVGHYSLLYLTAAVVAGGTMVYACSRLLSSLNTRNAWRLYRLSSFPYIGLIFAAMCLDIWLF